MVNESPIYCISVISLYQNNKDAQLEAIEMSTITPYSSTTFS